MMLIIVCFWVKRCQKKTQLGNPAKLRQLSHHPGYNTSVGLACLQWSDQCLGRRPFSQQWPSTSRTNPTPAPCRGIYLTSSLTRLRMRLRRSVTRASNWKTFTTSWNLGPTDRAFLWSILPEMRIRWDFKLFGFPFHFWHLWAWKVFPKKSFHDLQFESISFHKVLVVQERMGWGPMDKPEAGALW